MNADWSVLPLDFHIRLMQRGVFPAFKGVMLRGAFGVEFRKTVCTTRLPTCEGCPLLDTCAFPYVFTTLAVDDTDAALRSQRTHAPHPFSIRPPLDARRDVPEGTQWTFRFTLIGRARELLPYFVHAFLSLEKTGLGSERVPFELDKVNAPGLAKDWEVYRKGSSALRYPPASVGWPADEAAHTLRCKFTSLTRIMSEGRIVRAISFPILARAALRRVSALHLLYCGDLEENRDNRALLAIAEGIKTAHSDIAQHSLERYSTRTKSRMAFDGFTGVVMFDGDISPCMPILRAAAGVNVGKGATFGFGNMEFEIG
jgi:hypothetical protein